MYWLRKNWIGVFLAALVIGGLFNAALSGGANIRVVHDGADLRPLQPSI